jgi:hypothetical protein
MDTTAQGGNQHRYNVHDSRSLDSRAHARRSFIKLLWILLARGIHTAVCPIGFNSREIYWKVLLLLAHACSLRLVDTRSGPRACKPRECGNPFCSGMNGEGTRSRFACPFGGAHGRPRHSEVSIPKSLPEPSHGRFSRCYLHADGYPGARVVCGAVDRRPRGA